jgi:hypothetical protein
VPALAVLLVGAAPARALLGPGQGTYTPETPPPLIVKPPALAPAAALPATGSNQLPPGTAQNQTPPAVGITPHLTSQEGGGSLDEPGLHNPGLVRPTPEPGSLVLALLGSGALGLAGLRRRRRRGGP